MGNSVLWYAPEGADRYTRIDFGRRLSNIIGPRPRYRQTVQESLSGAESTIAYNGRSELTLVHRWNRGTRDASGDGDQLRRKLANLIAHLQRGGGCIFAGDEARAFAGFALTPPGDTDDSITVDVNLFSNLSTLVDASGQEVVVHTDHDGYLLEHHKCVTQTGTTVELEQGLAANMSTGRWVMVREYFTYAALRMPREYRESGDFLTHEHEMKFELALPLEEDPAMHDVLYEVGTPIPGTDPGPDPFNYWDLPGQGPTTSPNHGGWP